MDIHMLNIRGLEFRSARTELQRNAILDFYQLPLLLSFCANTNFNYDHAQDKITQYTFTMA